MTKRKRYNKEYLDSIIEEHNLILKINYENLTEKTSIEFNCLDCKEIYSKNFKSIDRSGFYCKQCTTNRAEIKKYETNMNKYGCKTPFESEEVKKKIMETNIEKYGVKHSMQNEDIKKKRDMNNIEKYGFTSPLLNEKVKEKTLETNIKKYGVDIPFKCEEVKKKITETINKKYGVNSPIQNEDIKKKMTETNIQKYGYNNPMQHKEIKNKAISTNIERYGCENPMQNSKISEKQLNSSYRRKEVNTPSGKIITLQGYEPQAYKILLDTYKEHEIVTSRKHVPEIWWNDVNGKTHRYFVDFYIPKDNLIIEVKSKRTYDVSIQKINKCIEASKEAGYLMKVWVLDESGNILQTIT
jgi:hypothetical protein